MQILVVEDEKQARDSLGKFLRHLGHDVRFAREGHEGLKSIGERMPDAVISDIRMPGLNGLGLLDEISRLSEPPPVILLTGYADMASAVSAIRLGAFDYLTKPAGLDELTACLLRLERQKELERRLEAERRVRLRAEAEASARKEADLRRRAAQPFSIVGGAIVAESPVMRALLEEAAGLAKTDSPVLIEGETGTGKEVIAEFIHQESDRRDGIMSAVNCGALSETLVDAELFGYEKGAFTGATEARQGIIEVADMGTLLV